MDGSTERLRADGVRVETDMGRTGRSSAASLNVLVGLAVLFCGCQRQQEYPNRPIMLICPWAAGGGTDRVSRQVAALLEQELKTPVNVINATGGAGVTGHTRGALAHSDGYTLTMVTVEINMLHWRGLTNISYQDFLPVGLLNRDAAAVFVRDDAPWQTLGQLEQHIRDNPGTVKASGTAEGGSWHLAFAGWLDIVGLDPGDCIWIPINGAAPSLQELLSGGVDVVCCSLPEARSLTDSGRVRALGVMADERVSGFSEVPTFREQGADWTLAGWRGICLPRDTPAELRQQVAAALERVVEGGAFQESMRQAGFNVTWQPSAQFAQTLEKGDVQFGKLLTSDAFRSVQRARFGPMFFPSVLIGLLVLVLAGLLLGGGLKRAETAESIDRHGFVRLAGIAAWVVAYVLLVGWAGFVVTAAGLLILLLRCLGNQWRQAIVAGVVIVPLTYHLFAVVLRVPLPHGWLGW